MNVLVFFTDQQRHDTTGASGCPLGLTPNYDRMAARGTHATHTFTMQPVCGPARACLQTGTYATTNGCWRNGIALDPQQRTLAHHFNDAGYRSGYIGKWHLSPNESRGAVPEEFRGGYQSWLAANALEMTSDAYQTRLFDENENAVDLPGYRVDAMTDATIRWIDEHQKSNREQPFFLFMSFLEPHHQNHRDNYPAPIGYENGWGNAWMPPDLQKLGGSAPEHWNGYCGMIKRLDEAFGRVQDALHSLDLSEDTIVLWTADHACHFKTRNDEYKRSCHEASIRVPLALDGGPFRNRGQVPGLVSLLDIPPTLLDACDVPIPDTMQGRSFLGRDNPRDDVFVQISESQIGRAVRTTRWKYSVRAPEGEGYKSSSAPLYREDALYDLESDPYELCDLSGITAFRGVADEMQTRLLKYIRDVEGTTPQIENAPARESGQRHV